MKDYTNLSQTASAGYDLGLRAHMLKVYNYMAAGLGVSGVIAYFAMSNPAFVNFAIQLKWVWFAALIGMAFFVMPRMYNMTETGAKATFFGYAALLSVAISPIFVAFTGESVARTFFITAATFASLSIYGYTTKKDLTSFGTFAIIGVWGVFFAGLINIFLQSPAIHFIASAVAVVASIALTAYDTQKIKQAYYVAGGNPEVTSKSAIIGALQRYCDFVYMFIHLLQFLGNRR